MRMIKKIELINEMVPALKELQSLVGLENVFKKVLDQIVTFLLDVLLQ